MFGKWIIENDFNVGTLPQKVASGLCEVFDGIVGVSFDPIMYLGHQVVNGTNHMILCKQTILTADPDERLVVLILHESSINAGKSNFEIIAINPII